MGYGPWPTGDRRRATGNRRRAFCLFLGLLTVRSADAAELGWTEVTVRVYHDGVIAEADEARAMTTAAATLAAADVTVRWMHCHKGAPSDEACSRPLGSGDLAVRLTRVKGAAAETRRRALGEALIPERGAPPAFAQLYLERVDDLAQRSRANTAVLLGRAMAHELTHLLTGSGRHATSGLMRPIWAAGDLRRDRPADWMLDAASVRTIRERASVPLTLARN